MLQVLNMLSWHNHSSLLYSDEGFTALTYWRRLNSGGDYLVYVGSGPGLQSKKNPQILLKKLSKKKNLKSWIEELVFNGNPPVECVDIFWRGGISRLMLVCKTLEVNYNLFCLIIILQLSKFAQLQCPLYILQIYCSHDRIAFWQEISPVAFCSPFLSFFKWNEEKYLSHAYIEIKNTCIDIGNTLF